MKKIILLTSILTLTFSLKAQDRLECKGPIPEHFTKLLSENINKDKVKLEQKNKKIKKEDAQDFLAVTNYGIQKYIKSGKLLYGDPLTEYASKVLSKLKAVSEENQDHVKVYTIRSTEVNAFAIHQGYIVITTGLWARLENEAQLAFILGHELNHITHQHSLKNLERSLEQIPNGQLTKDELSQEYKYAQSLELESDKEGFLLAQKAGYSDSLMAGALKMLAISHRPIKEIKVDYSLFEDDFFKLSSVYRLTKLEKVKDYWDRNTQNKIHPNAKNRYEALLPLFSESSSQSINAPSLQNYRSIARRDLLETYIIDGNYVDGLYHCLILLRDNPKDQFLLEAYAMMWYGLSAEKNIKNGVRYSYDFRLTSGELERFYYIFHNLNPQKMAILATREIWKAHFKTPDSEFINELKDKVLVEFVQHNANDISNFYTAEKISQLKRERRKLSNGFKNSLVILLDKPEFLSGLVDAKLYNSYRRVNDEIITEKRNVVSDSFDNSDLLFMYPLYSQTDLRLSVSNQLVSNEVKSNMLVKMAKDSKFSNTKINFLTPPTADSFTTDHYNEMGIIHTYVQENLKHRGSDFLPFSSRHLKDLNSLKGKTGVGLISFQSLVYKKRFVGSAAVFSAISVIGFPLYLRWQLEPQQYSLLSVLVFDLNTHNLSFRYIKSSNAQLNKYFENAQIYHILNQINNTSK